MWLLLSEDGDPPRPWRLLKLSPSGDLVRETPPDELLAKLAPRGEFLQTAPAGPLVGEWFKWYLPEPSHEITRKYTFDDD